jgi:hypothetical protein
MRVRDLSDGHETVAAVSSIRIGSDDGHSGENLLEHFRFQLDLQEIRFNWSRKPKGGRHNP